MNIFFELTKHQPLDANQSGMLCFQAAIYFIGLFLCVKFISNSEPVKKNEESEMNGAQ